VRDTEECVVNLSVIGSEGYTRMCGQSPSNLKGGNKGQCVFNLPLIGSEGYRRNVWSISKKKKLHEGTDH